MIDMISNWAGEIVISLVIVTIIEMLLPDNKIKKYVKTVIGVYIIFCIMSPFVNKEEFSTILKDTEKNLEKIQIISEVEALTDENTSIESLYIKEFEKDVIKRVEDLGYEVKKCDVNIEINATKENAGINSILLNIEKKKNQTEENIQIKNIEKVEISINDDNTGENNEEESEDVKKIKKILSEYYEIGEEKIRITQE